MDSDFRDAPSLRVAMVGVGGFGAHRRKLMRQAGCFKLVAAYDHNPEALAAACREDGAAAAESYEALLDTPGIDAMVISTGATAHAAQVIAAIERGLHVFVEKPVCTNEAELAQLRAIATRTDRVIATGHTDLTNDPVAECIRGLLHADALGRIAAAEVTTAHSGGLLIKPGDWRGRADANPGGMLFQCGVHKIHELMYYFGPVRQVSAMMRHDVHTTETADVAVCLLAFESGVVATLKAYHVTPYYHRLCIMGTAASLYRDDRFFDEGTTLQMQRHDAKHPGAKQPRETVAIPSVGDPCGSLRSFHRAVRTGSAAYPSLVDGLRAVAVVFAAERAAQSGVTESIEPIEAWSAQHA